jgi:hypothetical protein
MSYTQLKRDVEKLQAGIYALQYGARELAERQKETARLRERWKVVAPVPNVPTAAELAVRQALGLSEESFRKGTSTR